MRLRGIKKTSPAYVPEWGRCRFCRQSAQQSEMVKYGVRHHAHAVCLYQHRGIEVIDELHTWQLRHLPIVAMMGVGVTLEQVRVWQARIASEDAELAARGSTRTSNEDGAREDK
jgi:hypothetical protein